MPPATYGLGTYGALGGTYGGAAPSGPIQGSTSAISAAEATSKTTGG